MIRFYFLLIFICLLPFSSFLQEKTTQKYHSPLGIPLVLAANFGELRPNHFHMGVDFKTNGIEGLPLYSIEEGYVSRVKISPYGYGKVVYIDHPNGITSVYAELRSDFTLGACKDSLGYVCQNVLSGEINRACVS